MDIKESVKPAQRPRMQRIRKPRKYGKSVLQRDGAAHMSTESLYSQHHSLFKYFLIHKPLPLGPSPFTSQYQFMGPCPLDSSSQATPHWDPALSVVVLHFETNPILISFIIYWVGPSHSQSIISICFLNDKPSPVGTQPSLWWSGTFHMSRLP